MVKITYNKEDTRLAILKNKETVFEETIFSASDDERKERKNKLKQALYRGLSKETKKGLPWGDLTGIRPTKIAMGLIESVMNYPLNQKLITFFEDEKQTADDFMYGVNYCLSLYQKQCNEVMFNLLSSHDVDRITTRIKSKQKALELYAILLTMPGAPCVYYGDELLLDAPSRGTMPWNELLNNKEMTNSLYLMKKLMEIRSSYKELSNEKVSFIKSNKRLLHYLRPLLNGTLEVFVNEDKTDEMIVTSQESRILFESRYENGILKSGGILIILKN